MQKNSSNHNNIETQKKKKMKGDRRKKNVIIKLCTLCVFNKNRTPLNASVVDTRKNVRLMVLLAAAARLLLFLAVRLVYACAGGKP